jgi:hypothetical protein
LRNSYALVVLYPAQQQEQHLELKTSPSPPLAEGLQRKPPQQQLLLGV